jgi:hypothetical protein
VPSYVKEILEKFEFFPIKCVIQRAAELYNKGLETNEQNKIERTFKTKVLSPHAPTQKFTYGQGKRPRTMNLIFIFGDPAKLINMQKLVKNADTFVLLCRH